MSRLLPSLPLDRSRRLLRVYRDSLLDDLVPWWERYSPDPECGGTFTCLERDGRVYAGDKYTWMLGRQVWMFSRLYNGRKRRHEWLELARLGAGFLLDHALLDDGKMLFRLSREGRARARCLSLYTECFALMGFAELARATGDGALRTRAMEMYSRVADRLGQPDHTAMLGYPVEPSFHLHAHDMIRLTMAWLFSELEGDEGWSDEIRVSVDSLVGRHWKPELGALLENVAPDGSPLLELPEGRMFHPGHTVESGWMLMEVARRRGDRDLLDTAVEITLAALEHGWDEEFGGLRYLTNIDRTPTHELGADLKLWWPHSEALYATILGWALSDREDLRSWHERVHDYTFARFPDPEHGEWYGYLNREGSPVFTAKANGWKGFFHVPRALLRAVELLEEIVPGNADPG